MGSMKPTARAATALVLFFSFCSACSGTLGGTDDAMLDLGPAPPADAADFPAFDGSSEGIPVDDAGNIKANPGSKVYYVRPKGGTDSQCTGLANADYPGSGTGQACAFKHPFYALSPTGSVRMKGGDTLFLAAGSYMMGYGADGAGGCDASATWDCYLPAIPSGSSTAAPTRIVGEGWSTGCKSPPQLYGVERSNHVVSLIKSSNVLIECLEITDHSGCVESHSGSIACNRDNYPYGQWAVHGIQASDSKNVMLKSVNIHGLASRGIVAGRLQDWTLEDVRIVGNGWAGWDGDLNEDSSSNSGKLVFRRVVIEWNGCGETYPGKQPTGCWAQSAGGYGDGLGTAATAGNWVFEDCRVMHNTSDGIDLLYHDQGGTVTITRTRAEGNAGNQVKVTGPSTITNSILVGNCAFFEKKSFTLNVDPCRAMGNTLELTYTEGNAMKLVNSTLYGEGDVLVDVSVRDNHSCNGKESLVAINNIFLGAVEYNSSGEHAVAYYAEGCSSLKYEESYGVFYNMGSTCPVGSNDLCKDPLLGSITSTPFDVVPRSGSPALDSGKAVGGDVPSLDYLGHKRPYGKGVDRGAYEVN
jgi:hypothetical protein